MSTDHAPSRGRVSIGGAVEGTDSATLDHRQVRDDLERALSHTTELSLVFPNNLEEIDHWVAFRVHRPEFMRRDDYPIDTTIKFIFLPLPAALSTQYNQTYNSEGIGLAGMAGASLGKNYKDKGIRGLVDQIGNISMASITNGIEYYGLQLAEENVAAVVGGAIGLTLGQNMVSGALGAVAGAAGGQVLKGAVAGAGIARNPYMAVLYDSPQFRVHNFAWKFVPKNAQESKIITEIIHSFKYHSSPSAPRGRTHFFDYPEQFDIDFHYSDHLFNIGPSVLTGFEVNYHAEGSPLYHDIQVEDFEIDPSDLPVRPSGDIVDADGIIRSTTKAPVSIQISASFQEVAIVTKETISSQRR